MENWPDWFMEALKQRFDKLANASVTQHDIYSVRVKLSDITNELKKQLAPEVFLKILEWEETVNHQHTMEKEWLYFEGVRDGIRLIHPIYFNSGNCQSNG